MLTKVDIVRERLLNQRIARSAFSKPGDVVEWLGAVQAQDYAGAKWALGMRQRAATDAAIEQAFTDGSLLRTHLLRPTWHFVTPADIRWILTLTAPRVHAANAHYYHKLELDKNVFQRSNRALVKALQGGQQLTRDELRGILQRVGIATDDGLRMSYIMMRAELDGVVCSGARRGKQFTYASLDERVPSSKTLERDQALSELARRYFLSRGPATAQDFAKWSGLTLADARKGLAAIKENLQEETIDGQTYWFSTTAPATKNVSPAAHLLSIYDEYISGYKDRSAIVDADHAAKLIAMGNALNSIVLVKGRIVGTWKRTIKKDQVVIEANIFKSLTKSEKQAVANAAQEYGRFLDLKVVLTELS